MEVEAPEHPGGETGTSETPSGALNEDLLIKEAQRRHRRRLAVLGASVLVVASLVGTGVTLLSSTPSTPYRPPPPVHLPPPATSVPTSPALAASDPTCNASQLAIGYRGLGAGAGLEFSTFAIADTSAQPCALRSGVTVEFFDAQGNERIASTQVPADFALSPDAALPPLGQAPLSKEQLGEIIMGWPTLPNAITDLTGGVSGQCPEPLFTPQVAEITFAGLQPITVQPLVGGNEPPTPLVGSICGSNVRIEEADAWTS
jgi:hypothetical protein